MLARPGLRPEEITTGRRGGEVAVAGTRDGAPAVTVWLAAADAASSQ